MSRPLVVGGVVVACALGAGLGLWARPVGGESPAAAKPVEEAAETPTPGDRRLHIVVDDMPAASPARRLDVTPAAPKTSAVEAAVRAAAPIAPMLMAPRRPPEGLVRIDAPVPGPLAAAPAMLPVTRLRPAAVAAPPVQASRPAPRRPEHARAEPPKHATRLAKASATPKHASPRHPAAKLHDVEDARAAPEPRAHRTVAAVLEHVVHRLAVRERREEARADRPRREHKSEVQVAEAGRHAAKPAKHERAEPGPRAKGDGAIRLASVNTRCVSPDPGEALTCGSPALGAAERRMNRAYRDAEAAGVPRDRLEQQQQRWLAARAAAAREAPWAVRDVYQARIAELQDMARNARGE